MSWNPWSPGGGGGGSGGGGGGGATLSIALQTAIGLISNALILIGEKPLSSLTDNRYGATVGLNVFEGIYENELQSNRWRFASKKGALARLVDVPLNEFRYAFQLPTDMLLPIGLWPPRGGYEIYADHLYTDASAVDLEYLFKPAISELPAYFALLLVYALARDMVKPITESDNGVQVFEAKYQLQRSRALHADSQGRPNRPIAHSPFLVR